MKLFINIFLCLCLLLCVAKAHTQTRFSIRNDLGLSAVTFKGVDELSSGYGVICNGVNPTDSGILIPLTFAKYGFDGSLEETSFYYKETNYYLLNSLVGFNYLNNDFQYSCMGYTTDVDEITKGFIANFNQEGDTLSIIKFLSPYYETIENEFNAPQSVASSNLEDNSIFISSNISNPGITYGDFYILRMLPNGEVLWEYIQNGASNIEHCRALLPTPEGGVLSVFWAGSSGSKFLELDSVGNEVLQEDIEFNEPINDLVWAEDGNFVGSGGGPALDETLTGRIFKMNREGVVIWDTVIGLGYALSFQNQFYKVVNSPDGNYVAGGTKKIYVEEPTVQSGDKQDQAWLVKVDDDGEVMWQRTYHYVNSPDDDHSLNDLEATSDGGYIFCGEATDDDPTLEYSEGPKQQGWLVKVDEYGCLVEGCQLSDGINIIENQEEIEYFKAGPIPAGQFLNIYQSATSHQATYQLINLNGQVQTDFTGMSKGTTMMLDVSKYASGSYQLVLMEGNKVLQRQKIIKE